MSAEHDDYDAAADDAPADDSVNKGGPDDAQDDADDGGENNEAGGPVLSDIYNKNFQSADADEGDEDYSAPQAPAGGRSARARPRDPTEGGQYAVLQDDEEDEDDDAIPEPDDDDEEYEDEEEESDDDDASDDEPRRPAKRSRK